MSGFFQEVLRAEEAGNDAAGRGKRAPIWAHLGFLIIGS